MAEGSLQGGFALGPQEYRGQAQRRGALSGVTLEIVAMQGLGYCIGVFIPSGYVGENPYEGMGSNWNRIVEVMFFCRLARGRKGGGGGWKVRPSLGDALGKPQISWLCKGNLSLYVCKDITLTICASLQLQSLPTDLESSKSTSLVVCFDTLSWLKSY